MTTIARILLTAGCLIVGGACASAPGSRPDMVATAGELVVPLFSADDPRVGTAGFVSQTTRIGRSVDGVTYTLMVFAVGETLTLGAMVQGPFDGIASWEVGDRAFSVPLRRADRGRTAIEADGASAAGLRGQHGGFDDFDWVNVDVSLDEWLAEATSVALEFRADGQRVSVPDSGRFSAVLAPR